MDKHADLERTLARYLHRVAAPAELWARVQCPQLDVPARRAWFTGWRWSGVAVAAVLLAAAGSAFHGTADLELHSRNAVEIRSWVARRTGLDVPLRAKAADGIQLVGARVIQQGRAMAEVDYRVGNREATLLVSKAEGAEQPLRSEMRDGRRVSSWTRNGQFYTLSAVFTGESRDECLLCHEGLAN